MRVCKAVFYCHSQGVIHKDIKMENIMIRPDGSVKLIDFGYAELLPRAHSAPVKFCGTPYYMPPEFILNQYFNGTFWFISNF